MSRPTHLLRHEHRVIEQAMRALEGMCFRIRAGDDPPGAELSKMLDFIRIGENLDGVTNIEAATASCGKAQTAGGALAARCADHSWLCTTT